METTVTPDRPGKWLSALCGIVAAAGALSAASLVAVTSRAMRSPIVDVGDRFIEATPSWLKDLAISLFATNDKLALLVGIGLFMLLFAAGVGLVAMRSSLVWGALGIALFGGVGVVSALGSGRGPLAVLPSVAAAISGILLLGWLHRFWFSTDEPPEDTASGSRRRLLRGLAGAAVGFGLFGVAAMALSRRVDVSAAASGGLPPVAEPLPPIPNDASFDIAGLEPFITPNAEFYRIDTALSIPQVPPDDYELRIHGMVDRELTFSYQDLLRREQVEADITLTCVSNEVGGALVGNARWQGVRLDELLAEAGVAAGADQIVGRSYDGYTCGFPVAAATDGRDALVAVAMNGEPLPLEHGYPVRLVVPGLYGYVSATKWLREIEVTTFDAFDHYWERRGWAEKAPIKTSSRIDTPAPLARVPVGESAIAGVAWAQTRGVERVEVSVDEGPWQDADLGAEVNETTWRQWRLPWEVTPGRHSITVRATDSTGETQTKERVPPVPDGSTGWHSVVVFGGDA